MGPDNPHRPILKRKELEKMKKKKINKKAKPDYSAIKKLIFDKNGRVISSLNEVARKLGCTWPQVREVIRENFAKEKR